MHIWAGSCENTNLGSFDWEMMRFLHGVTDCPAGNCFQYHGLVLTHPGLPYSASHVCRGHPVCRVMRTAAKMRSLNVMFKCKKSSCSSQMYLVSFLDKASIFALWKPAVWLSRYLSVPRKSELEKATVLLEEWLRIENKLYFRKKKWEKLCFQTV